MPLSISLAREKMHRPLLKLRALSLVAIGALALLATSASAQLSIEITGAGANRIPVAIADFGGEAGLSRALTSVIRADLERDRQAVAARIIGG